MDASQVSGATSSYARKYALNGLFLIDDTKDADSQDNSDKTVTKKTTAKAKPAAKDDDIMGKAIQYIKSSNNKTTAYNQIIKKYGDQLTDKQKEGIKKFVG